MSDEATTHADPDFSRITEALALLPPGELRAVVRAALYRVDTGFGNEDDHVFDAAVASAGMKLLDGEDPVAEQAELDRLGAARNDQTA